MNTPIPDEELRKLMADAQAHEVFKALMRRHTGHHGLESYALPNAEGWVLVCVQDRVRYHVSPGDEKPIVVCEAGFCDEMGQSKPAGDGSGGHEARVDTPEVR